MAQSNKVDYYSSSHISIRYDVKNNFPEVWAKLPERAIEALIKAANQGLDLAYPSTPYDPIGYRSSIPLRDSTFIQVYANGPHGGTLYVQWRATNPYTGYHYGINQELGFDSIHGTYKNYTTPGTGPGFMEKTWSVIEQTVPLYLANETQSLIQENSVE